jgi:hypothetical protein
VALLVPAGADHACALRALVRNLTRRLAGVRLELGARQLLAGALRLRLALGARHSLLLPRRHGCVLSCALLTGEPTDRVAGMKELLSW